MDRIQRSHAKLESMGNVKDNNAIEELIGSDTLSKKVEEGAAAWELLGLSKEFMHALHEEAVHIYDTSHYEEAKDAFACLIALNHWEQRFWIGYGLSVMHSFRKDITTALDAFYMAIGIDETNPYPYIFYAEALAELGDPEVALEYLDVASSYASHSDQYKDVNDHIEKIKVKIKK